MLKFKHKDSYRQIHANLHTYIIMALRIVEAYAPDTFIYPDEKRLKHIYSGLESCLGNWYYANHKGSFKALTFNLFWRIIHGHYLINGNKRFAFAFLKLFLASYGYQWEIIEPTTEFEQTKIAEFLNRQCQINDEKNEVEGNGYRIKQETLDKEIKRWVFNNVK